MANLDIKDFSVVIQTHNAYLFDPMRNQFSEYSKALAKFVKTYPGTNTFSELEFASVLSQTSNTRPNVPSTIFDPWENWWQGVWSDGSDQYHIWDSTVKQGNQYIQPVTQSNKAFVNKKNIANFAHAGVVKNQRGNKPWVDLGINVVKNGVITGMVLKKNSQHPHWGYAVNSRTLLWITPYGNQYFLFFEWASKTEYGIHGRPFSLTTKGDIQTVNEIHFGKYDRVAPKP